MVTGLRCILALGKAIWIYNPLVLTRLVFSHKAEYKVCLHGNLTDLPCLYSLAICQVLVSLQTGQAPEGLN